MTRKQKRGLHTKFAQIIFENMTWIDTHAHLYVSAFEADYPLAVQRALDGGVDKIMLPNINVESLPDVISLSAAYPHQIFPMIGLHPCDVKADWEIQLSLLLKQMNDAHFVGIGETGIDLYWDKSTLEWQKQAFIQQIGWAIQYNKPIIIHARESMKIILEIIEQHWSQSLSGIFHCFSGDQEDLDRVVSLQNFKIGIGGTLTYKNNELPKLLKKEHLPYIVLETDSPYLPPVPHRGKRNESSYIPLIGEALSNVLAIPIENIAQITTKNAIEIFQL